MRIDYDTGTFGAPANVKIAEEIFGKLVQIRGMSRYRAPSGSTLVVTCRGIYETTRRKSSPLLALGGVIEKPAHLLPERHPRHIRTVPQG